MKRLTAFFSRRRAAAVAGIILITLATLLALAFLPGLRETQVARAIRFWEAPPAPAVPPGQLGVEVEQAGEAPGAITIDPDTAAALGLQTAVVEPGATAETLRTTGRVTPDERRVTQVFTKVDGWIEQTFANFEGQQISRGQPLFTYYSPDLVATQQEYLIALKARQDFGKSEFEVVRESGAELLAATRRRLQLWDVTPQQIAEIERTGKVLKNLTFYAPASGVITERKAFPGMRVMPDTALYTLADLSVIWVEADVFETDLAKIGVGTLGEVSLPDGQMMPGVKAIGGRVAFINPLIDPETRTAKVRLEFANPGLRLKPGMFVNVSLRAKQQPQLVVPRDAVLDTGVRKLVLVDEGDNRFALREITATLGQEVYAVQSGLKAGERVARNIQFLVDSETQLRQAVERAGGASSSSPSSAGAGATGSPGAAASPAMPNMPGMSDQGGKK
jgi:membrane fusion protein, copper/silver efflux system